MPNPPVQDVNSNSVSPSVKKEDDQVDDIDLVYAASLLCDVVDDADHDDPSEHSNINSSVNTTHTASTVPSHDFPANFVGSPVNEPITYNLYKKRKPHQGDPLIASVTVQRPLSPPSDDNVSPPPSPSYFTDFIDSLPSSAPASPVSPPLPPKKKFKWVPVAGKFDASKVKPSLTPRVSVGVTLPPLTPNGATADALILADLSATLKWCLVLINVLRHVDDGYLRDYHAHNNLPLVVDILVIEAAARALIYYDCEDDWKEAKEHDWAIGTVDEEAAKDPKGDHAAHFRITLAFHTSRLRDPVVEIGIALAAYDIRVISVTRANGTGRFFTVYLASLPDYLRALTISGDIVAGQEGQIMVLTPRHDLSSTSSREIVRLYIGGLPSNPSEEKILALLRSATRLAGLDPKAVLAFYVHRHQGNMKSSYGFAQVRGSDVAAALVNAAIRAKGINLTISLAVKSKKRDE